MAATPKNAKWLLLRVCTDETCPAFATPTSGQDTSIERGKICTFRCFFVSPGGNATSTSTSYTYTTTRNRHEGSPEPRK